MVNGSITLKSIHSKSTSAQRKYYIRWYAQMKVIFKCQDLEILNDGLFGLEVNATEDKNDMFLIHHCVDLNIFTKFVKNKWTRVQVIHSRSCMVVVKN